MKKISMFSDGTLVVAENNKSRKANELEISDFLKSASNENVVKYLSNIFPNEKDGNELEFVQLDKKSGFAYGKYANSTKLLKKKVLASPSSSSTTEPVDSVSRSDEHKGKSEKFDVPRSESKSKPSEFKGRDDVNNPTEIRSNKYEKGSGAKNVHTNEVPRDSKGDGAGGKSTTFEDEVSNKATSGKPDTYVQEFESSESPEKAGSEKNHTAATNNKSIEVKFASDDLRFKFAKEDNDKEDDKAKNHKSEEKDNDKTDKPSKKLPPWLNKSKDSSDEEKDDEATKEANNEMVELVEKLAEKDRQILKLEKDLNNRKIAEARKEAAVGLVLTYRDRQPEKYASLQDFNSKVTDIAKKMSVESIQSALDEFNGLIQSEQLHQRKVAAANGSNSKSSALPELSHSIVIPQDNYKFASNNGIDDLVSVLMQSTALGKSVSSMERYRNQQNNE